MSKQITNPVIFIFPSGRTLVRPSGLDAYFKGVKLNSQRPHIILYPEGMLSESTIVDFKYILMPYKGQAISYKPNDVLCVTSFASI